MRNSRSTRLGLTSYGKVNSGTWGRSIARKCSNRRYSKDQLNINQPRQSDSAVRVWIENSAMLTRKILLEIILGLPAKDIHDLIDELIEGLDGRSGDPDVEAEPTEDDDESEAEAVEDDDESERECTEDDDVLVVKT